MVVLKESVHTLKQDSAIHPLLIDHVVEKILRLVYNDNKTSVEPRDPKTLLPYRTVCRLWNEIATGLYHKSKQVEVGSYSTSIPKFRRLIKLRKTKSSLSSSWPCAFTNFRLCQEVFQPIYAAVVTDFFQTFQDSLETLDIWLDLRSTLVDIPIHGKVSFPNLKTLHYDDRRVIFEGCKDTRGTLLNSLITVAPSLENLSIRFQRDFRGSVECINDILFIRLLKIFRILPNSLKYLNLDFHINDKLLKYLQGCDLRVSSLSIAIRGSTFSYAVFQSFLESLHLRLKKLKLSYIERDSNCLICFPRLHALQELEIDGTDAFSKHSVSFGDFTYCDNLPHLNALRVNIWGTVNLRWQQFIPVKTQIETITELKLPGELCDTNMMNCVATAFPKLNKLHISLYSLTLDSMEVIFERMTQLQELTVTKFPSLWDRNEKNIDHILTGISASDCDKLSKENVTLHTISEEEIMRLKTSFGLTDLPNLRKLMMPDLQYQASYTDISGYLAFQKIPNLKYLNVGRSYLSNACLLQLARKFPEMEAQRRLPPIYYKESEDEDDTSFLELPGDTCVYL